MITKTELRRLALSKRRSLSPIQKHIAAAACVARLRQTPFYDRSDHIALYFPFPDEVSPLLTSNLDQHRKTFYLPVVRPNLSLAFAPWQLGDALQKGRLNTWEPSRSATITVDDLDLVVVPGVAFDANCQRIGMGKGCYDRALTRVTNRVMLAYDEQRTEPIAIDAWDQPMDCVITPSELFLPPRV